MLSCLLVLGGTMPEASAFGFGGMRGGFGGGYSYGGSRPSGGYYGGAQPYGSGRYGNYPRPAGPYGRSPQASVPGRAYPGGGYRHPYPVSHWPHPRPRPMPVSTEPLDPPPAGLHRGIRAVPVTQETPPRPPEPPRSVTPPLAPAPARTRSGMPSPDEQRYVPDEVIFTAGGPPSLSKSLGAKHHLTLISSHAIGLIGGGSLNRYRIADKRSVPDVIRELETETQITWAQPNYMFKLSDAVETAPKGLASAQYALAKLHLTEAHRLADGSHTRVALIDSGVDEQHKDLAGTVVERFDSVGGTITAHSHGTAMAGAIGAHGALTGVAPHADLLAARAFTGSDGKPGADGTTAHIVDALEWAANHQARIINMSFAGPFDPLIALALRSVHEKDIVLVAAAGNEGPGAKPAYPASDRNVIAVTATDRNDKIFDAANRGTYIALAAPGTDVIAASPANNYQFTSGTSIAAAHISGVIALLLSEKPDLSADSVRRILKDTAHELGQPDEFGAGLGDAGRATAVVKVLKDESAQSSEPQKTTAAR